MNKITNVHVRYRQALEIAAGSDVSVYNFGEVIDEIRELPGKTFMGCEFEIIAGRLLKSIDATARQAFGRKSGVTRAAIIRELKKPVTGAMPNWLGAWCFICEGRRFYNSDTGQLLRIGAFDAVFAGEDDVKALKKRASVLARYDYKCKLFMDVAEFNAYARKTGKTELQRVGKKR